jgi:putative transposase
MYLVVIMDWYSRRVLAWRISNTLEAEFCVAALEEAIRRHGCPEIFNTDQGSQFTSQAFTGVLESHGIQISMDGRGRFHDNIFVERLWWTTKYQYLYLHAFEGGMDLRRGLGEWFGFYNQERPHQALNNMTPDEVYFGGAASNFEVAA